MTAFEYRPIVLYLTLSLCSSMLHKVIAKKTLWIRNLTSFIDTEFEKRHFQVKGGIAVPMHL